MSSTQRVWAAYCPTCDGMGVQVEWLPMGRARYVCEQGHEWADLAVVPEKPAQYGGTIYVPTPGGAAGGSPLPPRPP